jgi:hypothetical protein
MVEAEAQRIVDARIPGLQSAYEKQIAGLRKELQSAREDSGYTPDDSQLQAELEKARREADALRAGRQYPNAYPAYEALMSAGTVEEQLEFLENYIKDSPSDTPPPAQETAGSTPAPAPAPDVPVDPNNPPREQAAYVGGEWTDPAEAMKFIDKFKVWPRG